MERGKDGAAVKQEANVVNIEDQQGEEMDVDQNMIKKEDDAPIGNVMDSLGGDNHIGNHVGNELKTKNDDESQTPIGARKKKLS